jgi:hypothetical protein
LLLLLVLLVLLLVLAAMVLLWLTTVMRLLVSWSTIASALLGRYRLTTLQVYVDPALILLRPILQSQLAANLLHSRLDLLYVPHAMIALPNNDVQVRLALGLRGTNPLLQNVLGLFHELSMQINHVALLMCVVLPEDEVRRLLVVFSHLRAVRLALVGELLRARTIAAIVGFFAALETLAAFAGFLSR